VRTKLKNYRTGAVIDRTFRADEKVPLAVIDKREMQYLYREPSSLVFMDNESYDQLHVEASDLGDAVNFLLEPFESNDSNDATDFVVQLCR